jgi:GDP-L-fucose synthase
MASPDSGEIEGQKQAPPAEEVEGQKPTSAIEDMEALQKALAEQKELAEKISRIVGYKGKLIFDKTKPDGAPRKCLDSSRLNGLGWRARISLDEGLRKTIEWYKRSVL